MLSIASSQCILTTSLEFFLKFGATCGKFWWRLVTETTSLDLEQPKLT